MLKRLLSCGLVALLLHAADSMPILAFARADQRPPPVEKVKADVAKRGTGKKARVKVKLQDGSKLKGYISQAEEDSFTLTDSKTGQTRTLTYREVTEVKKQGGLSLTAKIGIGLGIAAGGLALLYAIGCHDDPIC
ncbi:MAG TPA: hypothetical protein VFX96_10185 [Pyrinomonadaceae bacterium]|nr:hypothetical protein [Pyrinomonadaceae bacterium]